MTTSVAGPKNKRWISHRITAHKMHDRGQPVEVIADHLRVHVRSVSRYLALPRPEPLEPHPRVEDFFMKGACGAFPELDWQSKSPRMQAECKAVCTYCPVLAQCRTYGLTKGAGDLGIWGAMTRHERMRRVTSERASTSAAAEEVVA